MGKKLNKMFIFHFEKAIFYILTCVMIFVYTRTLYDVNWLSEAVRNAGIRPVELIFMMGVITGVWCLWTFLVLVFVDWNDEKGEDTVNEIPNKI